MPFQLDTNLMPTLNPAPARRGGLITSALASGYHDLLGTAASGLEAVGAGFGLSGVQHFAGDISREQQQLSTAASRPDLDVAPWRAGGASVLPWLAYQSIKQIPQLAAYEAGARLLPDAAVPGAVARLGTAAPRVLGGGGMRAAQAATASAEELAAAQAEGQTFAKRAIATQIVGMPLAAGSMYQEAHNAADAEHREPTRAEALSALAMSPFYAALDTVDLNVLHGVSSIARAEGVRGLVRKVGLGSLVGAATELPQEGIQTAMEQSFRTDLTPQQKISNIVDAALTGAATGGAMAGAMSVRSAQRTPAHEMTNDDITHVVNDALGLPAPTVTADSAGRSAFGSGGLQDLVSTPISPGMSDTDRQVASYYAGQGGPAQIESQTIIQPKTGSLRWAQDYSQTEGRPFGAAPTDELQSAAQTMESYLADKDPASFSARDQKVAERYDQVAAELEFRTNELAKNNKGVDNAAVGAVEPDPAVSGGVGQVSAPASTTQSIEETLKGISTRRSYKDVTTPEELRTRLTERLTAGSTAKGDMTLAERLGIDVNAPAVVNPVNKEAPGLTLYHGARNADFSLDTIDTDRVGTLQGKKNRTYGGFYTAASPNAAAVYAGPNGTVHSVEIKPGAKVENTTKDIMRLSQEDRDAYRARGVDVLVGKDVRGQEEHVVLNKDAISAVTPVEGKVEPLDKTFQRNWNETLAEHRGAAIQDLKTNLAPNEAAAKRQVYEALGATNGDTKVDGYKGLTALAEKLGIQDAEGQLTPEGVKVARSAIPLEATAQAAQEAGYAGADVSAFDRGARGDKRQNLNSIAELKAWTDGQSWATDRKGATAPIPAVAGETATQAFVEGNTADANGRTISSSGIPKSTQDAKWLNLAVDQVYGSKLDPGAQAQLKTMIRGGATPAELDHAAERIKSGEVVLANPAPSKPYTGETVTRGMLNTKTAAARRTAVAQERVMAEKRREGFGTLTSTEQDQFIKDKAARRGTINDAYEAGEITAKDRIGLLFKLTRGKFQEIDDKLSNAQVQGSIISDDNPIRNRMQWVEVMNDQKAMIDRVNDIRTQVAESDRNGDEAAAAAARQKLMEAQLQLGAHMAEWGDHLDQWEGVIQGKVSESDALGGSRFAEQLASQAFLKSISDRLSTPTQRAAAKPVLVARESLNQQLKAGNIGGALSQIQQHSANPIYRAIAAKLANADWSNVRLNVLQDPYSPVRGLTTLQDDGSTRVDLYNGLSEETTLHELIHAFVQQRWGALSVYTAQNRALLKDATDRSDATVEGFVDLWKQFGSALEKTNPELIDGETFASEIWRDPDEMLSWVMTNAKAQAYLSTVDRDGNPVPQKQSLWNKFLGWVSGLIGLPVNTKTQSALDTIMHAGMSVLDAGVNVTSNDFSKKIGEAQAQQRAQVQEGTFDAQAPFVATISNAQYHDTVSKIEEFADKIPKVGLKGKLREMALGWTSVHGANEMWGSWFDIKDGKGETVANGAKAWEEALNEKNAISARLSLMMTDVRDRFQALQRANRNSTETIVQLMQMSEFGINPTKPWREQSEAIRNHKNAANLEKITKQAHDLYRKLASRDHADVYHDLRNVNDVLMLSTLAVSFHQQVDLDGHAKGRLPEFAEPPMDTFMREQATREFNSADARKWWNDRLSSQVAAMSKFLEGQRAIDASGTLASVEAEAFKTHISDIGKRILGIQQTVRQLEDAPYFHLGRYGDFFVGWKVPNSDALGKLGDALDKKGFKGVISDGTDKLRVYMRMESENSQVELNNLLRELEKKGLVEPETIRVGKRTKENFAGGFQPQWANQMIASIEGSGLPKDVAEMTINSLRGYSVDLMPEMSLARVMTHREGVPGYDPDMMRSFDWRGQVGINALAGAASSPKITQAFVDMRGALNDAEKAHSDDVPVDQKNGMRTMVDEYSRRERERSMWPETHLADQLSSISTAWFLGFSASYGFVNMTQLGATLLPELGSKHGFVASSKAIAKATPIAFKIMKEVAKHGYNISLERAQDAVITSDVLKKVVGKETAEYLMRVVNTGNLDIGGPSRELARAAEGRGDDKIDKVLRYASSIGYYTETMSRLITAIATRQLNPQMNVEEAAKEAAYNLNEAMWNYSRTNQGRQFGKMGVLGSYTPLATKFMQFQAQLSEKLFREIYDSIKGETPESRKQARGYLKGHLAAMTVLAGTLSLPAMTLAATIFDRLKDLFDDDEEPSNIRADYRNWLAQTLGPDAGEIIAHGGFRAAGFDISNRIGEQDIVPFSRFLADRRAFKDSIPDLATRTWGAPFSLVRNVLEGGEKVASGDMAGGLSRMLPNGLAGPAKAVRLYNGGYLDEAGNRVPMEPGPFDVALQLFGLNPSRAAEMSEARNDQRQRRGELQRNGSNLANQIVTALEGGDRDTARSLIERATRFDQANPTAAILPSLGDRIARRRRLTAVAGATGSPLGVNPADLGARDLTSYANY